MNRHESTVHSRISRRMFLNQSGIALGAAVAGSLGGNESSVQAAVSTSDQKTRRPKVAAIFTEMQFRSHAYDILENFFQIIRKSGTEAFQIIPDVRCEICVNGGSIATRHHFDHRHDFMRK